MHGATNKDLTLCTSKTWELLGADAGHEDALSQGPKAEPTQQLWQGRIALKRRRDGQPYELELRSESDWASCKITRR